jgi:alanine racemase
MDMIAVDIGNAKVAIGDKAILWGDEKLRVETVAYHSGTIGLQCFDRDNRR